MDLKKSADFVRSKLGTAPTVGVILGSGLGGFANSLAEPLTIAYADIPEFPRVSVQGHAGRLLAGTLERLPIAVMQGRVHLYEGYSAEQVVAPVHLLALLGVRYLVITNAAGGISPSLQPADLMLIEDHINLTGQNPLIGHTETERGTRFVDMSDAYDTALIRSAERAARTQGISLKRGVYAGVQGPSYETPAEVRMLRTLGADAVGMSTVLEVIAARQLKLRVLGLSCITNTAAGLDASHPNHEEVTSVAQKTTRDLSNLLRQLLKDLPS